MGRRAALNRAPEKGAGRARVGGRARAPRAAQHGRWEMSVSSDVPSSLDVEGPSQTAPTGASVCVWTRVCGVLSDGPVGPRPQRACERSATSGCDGAVGRGRHSTGCVAQRQMV